MCFILKVIKRLKVYINLLKIRFNKKDTYYKWKSIFWAALIKNRNLFSPKSDWNEFEIWLFDSTYWFSLKKRFILFHLVKHQLLFAIEHLHLLHPNLVCFSPNSQVPQGNHFPCLIQIFWHTMLEMAYVRSLLII